MSLRKQHIAVFLLTLIVSLSSCQKEEKKSTNMNNYSVEGGCGYFVNQVPEAVFLMDSMPDHYNVNDTIFITGSISGLQVHAQYRLTIKSVLAQQALIDDHRLHNLQVFCDTFVVNSADPDSIKIQITVQQFQPENGSSYGCAGMDFPSWTKTVAIN